jgi:hypothetical protein
MAAILLDVVTGPIRNNFCLVGQNCKAFLQIVLCGVVQANLK